MSRTGKRASEGTSSAAPSTKKGKAPSEEGPLRGFVPERNLSLIDTDTIPSLTQLREYITSHDLQGLASLNTKYKEEVVREFYQNFPRSTASTAREVTVRVRGKQVRLSLAILEEVIGLPHVTEEEEVDYFEEILGVGVSDLADATYVDPTSLASQRAQRIQSGAFQHIYRVYWTLVRNNILPTSQHSEVPEDSCRLLTMMVNDERPIPFARLILSSIITCALAVRRIKLVFPCLITRLCARARVPGMDEEPWVDGTAILDERSVGRSNSQASVVSHAPRSSSSSQGAASSHPTSSYTAPPLPFDPSQVDPHTLAMFQHFQGHVDGRLNTMDARLDEIYSLVRQLARTGFAPGEGPSGSDFGGPYDGGHGTGDGSH